MVGEAEFFRGVFGFEGVFVVSEGVVFFGFLLFFFLIAVEGFDPVVSVLREGVDF